MPHAPSSDDIRVLFRRALRNLVLFGAVLLAVNAGALWS